MDNITLCLWFNGQAEEAANYYCSIFPDSKVEEVSRYGEVGPMPKGTVMTVTFRAGGQRFTALNGGPEFKFNPAVSFVVACKDQREIDSLWDKLSTGGKPGRCGWLEDKFGVSWQVIPIGIGALIRTPAAMRAMLEMGKLDIQRLEDAAKS